MSFLESLKKLFSGGSGGSKQGNRQTFVLYVMDHRCREPMRGEVNVLSELSAGEDGEFFCRKVLHTSGVKRCFGQVEVQLWFDSRKNFLRQEVSGGKWLSAEEYAVELARFNAPPEEDDENNNEEEQIEHGSDGVNGL